MTRYETFPQILTRNTVIPSLAALDAGDVIECYTLMRMANLENEISLSSLDSRRTGGSDGSGSTNKNSNKNNNIPVLKTALAFRFKGNSKTYDSVEKAPFEVVLEYGPQRTGATQTNEAMPIVNGNASDLEKNGSNGDSIYLSWKNHAKIYYTLAIEESEWMNAYYMATINGAVLSKILDYIHDYTIHFPRYQPFTVMAKNRPDYPVLKSSSSDDFVWDVFHVLADWYVSVDPVLAPTRYSLRLYVEDDKRDLEKLGGQIMIDHDGDDGDAAMDRAGGSSSSGRSSNGNNGGGGGSAVKQQSVAHAAAQFYDHLYYCIGSIKAGDYSTFERKPNLTVAPSISDDDDKYYSNDDFDSLQGADDAKIAAEEAEKAAEKAKEAATSTEDSEAMAATEHAAKVAKKAALAITETAALMAKENLLGGDGAMATSILSTCFSDPKYKIRRDLSTNRSVTTTTTHVYLYYDGVDYFRLNLTAPYLTSTELIRNHPSQLFIPEGRGDSVKFILAFTIILGLYFGNLVRLHHSRIANFFSLFFQPDHHKSNIGVNRAEVGGERAENRSYECEMQSMNDQMQPFNHEEKTNLN